MKYFLNLCSWALPNIPVLLLQASVLLSTRENVASALVEDLLRAAIELKKQRRAVHLAEEEERRRREAEERAAEAARLAAEMAALEEDEEGEEGDEGLGEEQEGYE